MVRHLLSSFCASGLALSPAFALARSEALKLEPSSKWWVDYDEDSCVLQRTFGEGKDLHGLKIEMFAPGYGFFLTVSGKTFSRWSEGNRAEIRFGPAEEGHDINFFRAATTTKLPAILVDSSMWIGKLPQGVPLTRIFTLELEAREAAAKELVFSRRGRAELILNTGSLGAAFKEMRKCTADLYKVWGLDAQQQSRLTKPATPRSNPGLWIQSEDYPKSAALAGERAMIHFRLDVGPDGKPTGCHIQRAVGDAAFRKAVCKNMMAHARFDPALDASGQPVASVFISSVRFIFPR